MILKHSNDILFDNKFRILQDTNELTLVILPNYDLKRDMQTAYKIYREFYHFFLFRSTMLHVLPYKKKVCGKARAITRVIHFEKKMTAFSKHDKGQIIIFQ